MVTKLTEHPVQQRHRGGLAVGTGDAYQRQLLRRMPVPVGGYQTERPAAVGNDDGGHLAACLWQLLANNRHSTRRHGLAYEVVTVNLGATLRHKERAFRHTARVELYVLHVHTCRAMHLGINTLYYIFQYHLSYLFYPVYLNVSTTVAPFFIGSPALGLCEATLP